MALAFPKEGERAVSPREDKKTRKCRGGEEEALFVQISRQNARVFQVREWGVGRCKSQLACMMREFGCGSGGVGGEGACIIKKRSQARGAAERNVCM
jgi:hypothetical protein